MDQKTLCLFVLQCYGKLSYCQIDVRYAPHQCGASYGSAPPSNCVALNSDTLFFVDRFGSATVVIANSYSDKSTRDAFGYGGFNYSNVSLNYTAAIGGLFPFWDETLDLTVLESTRSGQLNLEGLESDALYPFDW